MNPLDPTILVLGVLATTILFAVIAFFTRATPRRIARVIIAHHRFMLGLQGVLTALLGVLVLTWPGISMISLLVVIICFAFVSGIVEIVVAFQGRDLWLGLSGLISIVFGLYALRFPGDGALAVLAVIGIYAIFVGVILIIASFQVRKFGSVPPLTSAATAITGSVR